jgi:Glycine-rich domain-containing protein-like
MAGEGNFSTDLVEAAKKHLHFLSTLHRLGTTLSPPVSDSLRRYVELWLPLVFKCQDKNEKVLDGAKEGGAAPYCALVPPPDIAWLWHCHRLAPSEYEASVRGRFGRLLEASPSFAVQTDDAVKGHDEIVTRQKWNEEHPNEPFFLPKGDDSKLLSSEECRESLNGFDLLASTKAQANFLWQVSRPQFRDDTFLHQGAERYYKFLKLSSLQGIECILVPTYQVRHSRISARLARCRTSQTCQTVSNSFFIFHLSD